MTLEAWFWIAHVPALAGWLALIILPANRGVRLARWAAALLAFGYLLLFLFFARDTLVLVREYGLGGVAAWFDIPGLMLLGWVHYLAFDLFVGSWEAEEGARSGVPRAVLIPCLILTCMLGPLGLLAFLVARRLRNNSIAS